MFPFHLAAKDAEALCNTFVFMVPPSHREQVALVNRMEVDGIEYAYSWKALGTL